MIISRFGLEEIVNPKNIRPKIVILVIYKISDGHWRGFCSPYDVSCNGATKKGVLESLKELVSLYEEGLEQYGYPRHLSIKPLSDPEDEKVLKKALQLIAETEKEKLTKDYYKYQEQECNKFTIKNQEHSLSGYYYHQQPAAG